MISAAGGSIGIETVQRQFLIVAALFVGDQT